MVNGWRQETNLRAYQILVNNAKDFLTIDWYASTQVRKYANWEILIIYYNNVRASMYIIMCTNSQSAKCVLAYLRTCVLCVSCLLTELIIRYLDFCPKNYQKKHVKMFV